jgi:hypothetical protein
MRTDPGVLKVIYLPFGAPDREIRFVEVNDLIATRDSDPIEPFDFGVDDGSPTSHRLRIVDVTPKQWEQIEKKQLPLPTGWSLEASEVIAQR